MRARHAACTNALLLVLALAAAPGAIADDAAFAALLTAASRNLQSPAAPFEEEDGTPPNLDAYGFDNWLAREQPGLAREYTRLDADARRQVYARYRAEPTLAAIRDSILARSRP